MLKMTLFDYKHWLGWFITTGAIVGLLHLLEIHTIHSPWYNTLYLLAMIIVTDIIKHYIKLQ